MRWLAAHHGGDYLQPPSPARRRWEGGQDGLVLVSKSLTLSVHLPSPKDCNFLDGENINLIFLHRSVVIIGSAVGWSVAWSRCQHFGGGVGKAGGLLVSCPEKHGWLPHSACQGVQKSASALIRQPHGMAPVWTSAFMHCLRGLKQEKEKDTTAMPALRL